MLLSLKTNLYYSRITADGLADAKVTYAPVPVVLRLLRQLLR